MSNDQRQITKDESVSGGVEWFAAYLPKPAPPAPDTSPEAQPAVVEPTFLDEVRAEIEAVSRHLADPSAAGVRASIPHLERAIAAFGNHVKSGETSAIIQPAAQALRAEVSIATRLFENAYELHAVWATQLGIHLDGTPRQLLYGRPSQLFLNRPGQGPIDDSGCSRPEASESWEG